MTASPFKPEKLNAALRALAHPGRRRVLDWLKAPARHFPPQVEGDVEKDGVCGRSIAEKLGVAQPTASAHLKILVEAGLVRTRRKRNWTYYRRREKAIRALKEAFAAEI